MDPNPSPVTPGVNYTPPQAWGADQTTAPVEMLPPIAPPPSVTTTTTQTTPAPPTSPTTETNNPSFFRTFLVGIALILFGALLGVLASRFFPMSANIPTPAPEPTTVVTLEPTPDPGNLGSCVPVYKVETNTQELTAKQNYSMYCSEKRSETECLSVDVYNQKLDDFSSPDGSPDCIWNKPISAPSSVEGTFCGGIAANLPENQCPDGFYCKLDGKYPDAGGVCSKK